MGIFAVTLYAGGLGVLPSWYRPDAYHIFKSMLGRKFKIVMFYEYIAIQAKPIISITYAQ